MKATELSNDEVQAIRSIVDRLNTEKIPYYPRFEFFNNLLGVFQEDSIDRLETHAVCPEGSAKPRTKKERYQTVVPDTRETGFQIEKCYSLPAKPERTQPSWEFGFESDFSKNVQRLDANTRGRVLNAIFKICDAPTQRRGDTVKPLDGELAGFWRFRVGDYRIIYRPDVEKGRVTFIDFGPRGSIY